MAPHFHGPKYDPNISPEDTVRAVLALFSSDPDYRGFDTEALKNITVLSASAESQTINFEMTNTLALSNKNAVLHGGAAATLLDMLTSCILGILSRPGYLDKGHVSQTLTMTYLRPVPVGTKVKVDCWATGVGRTMANLNGIIKTMDGKVCVSCVHDKILIPGTKL